MAKPHAGRPLGPRPPGTFASRLTRARLAAGLSQGAAAELLGKTLRTIQRWEAGESPGELAEAGAIAALKARARRSHP